MKITIEDTSLGIKVTSEPNMTCKNITIYHESNYKLGMYDNRYMRALQDHITRTGGKTNYES